MPVMDESLTSRTTKSARTSGEQERALVQRIVASPGFKKSVMLANFLNYICERKLEGRENEINEHLIGIHAFGRSPSYNPAEDNIVRSYARTLRQRLETYFVTEGRFESVHIVIPRGSYVPLFELAASPPAPDEMISSIRVDTVSALGRNSPRTKFVLLIASMLIAVAALVFGYRSWTRVPNENFNVFWAQMLDSRRVNLLVLADSGLAIMQDLSGHQIHLHEYTSGEFEKVFPGLDEKLPMAAKKYGAGRFKNLTSTADVHTLLDLTQLPQFVPAHMRVRYARDIRMEDISSANAIIVGGPRANPWVELYEPLSDFRIEIPNDLKGPDVDTRVVINKRPLPGENATYRNTDNVEGPTNHSVLSYLPSVDGHGHALLFQGGNMGATQAAADFATNADAMEPILAKARQPNGNIRPFEILLETRVIGASSPKATIVTVHYH